MLLIQQSVEMGQDEVVWVGKGLRFWITFEESGQ